MNVLGTDKRPALTRDFILETALGIVDEHGINGLTMRRLGTELGTDPMMLYRHFPGKAAVLDGLMEVIWHGVQAPDPQGGDTGWREHLVRVMHALRESLLAHPRAIVIVGTRPATGPELFALMERLLASLVSAGMSADAETADLLNALVNYTVGHVLAEAGDPVGGDADPESNQQVSPAHFPHLAAVFNSGWQYDPHRQYDRALRAFVGGWQGADTLAHGEGAGE